MTAISRRMLISFAAAAAIAAPALGGMAVATADTTTPAPPTGSFTFNIPGPQSDKDKKDDKKDDDKKDDDKKDNDDKKASVEKIQKVLDSIQQAKDPEELEKKLDKDIETLEDNESAVPSKAKDAYKKFETELSDAKKKESLDGDKADDTLKKIQGDAKSLSAVLKAAS
ncbi:hypothetical protein [Nocardia vaccinii]|uniref:hypothetical protein n=1 Tax=Nocardia vaccinii TaxID=1822 RepID=UPI000AF70CB6|nr:hypothetical protein [Nocardia vaccinii]